jgi:tetratricopeptide (TPR) repeat protein
VRRRAHNDLYGTVYTLNNLGAVFDRRQEYKEARKLYEEALALAQEINYRSGISLCLLNLGALAINEGDHEEALRVSQEALAVTQEINDHRNVAWAFTNLGNASLGLGDYITAARFLHQAVRLALGLRAIPRALAAMTSIATLAARVGEHEQAAELASFCLHHVASQKVTQTYAALLLAELSGKVSAEVIAAAQAKGNAMTLEQVVEALPFADP